MAQPTPYTPTYDFTDWQTAHPSDPLPGDEVDIQFNAIATFANQVCTNLALIQRDDGALANNSVGIDQLSSEIDFGFATLTTWTTGVAYVVRDGVYFGANVYRCLVAHTSDTFSTDLAAGKWVLVANFQQFLDAADASADAAAASAADAAADAIDTAADRVQTGLDVIAAAGSAAAAAASAAGMKYRSVRAGTTANITLSGAQTIDGVSVVAGERVLVKNQSTAANNGIYVCAAGAWTRATDMDSWLEVPGIVAVVTEGSTQADSVWLCTANDGGTLGSTAIPFVDWGAVIIAGSVALSKLAAQASDTILANILGSSASPTAVAIAANQFLAKSSAGQLGAKAITDLAFSLLSRATAALMRTDLGAAASGANTDISTIIASRPENLQTASYTLVLGDAGLFVRMNVAGANNLTIPLNSSVAFPVGTEVDIGQYGAGQTTVVATGGVTIRSKNGNLKLTGQYSGATIKKIGTDEWMLFGDLTA